MGKGNQTIDPSRAGHGRCAGRAGWRVWLWVLIWLGAALPARGVLQFDVFLGYGGQPTGGDGVVREASWFPVACEVVNDGPPFNAVFELSSGSVGGGQTRRVTLELPTNTRKRFVIPAFSGSGTYSTWNARLLDERGRVKAEKLGLRPRGLTWEGLLLGAVPRSFSGMPKFPDLKPGGNARSLLQPLVARMPVELLPEAPMAWEGMDALYLNSEQAVELRAGQAEALRTWVLSGGHLIVGVEQASDLGGAPWLADLLPMELKGSEVLKPGPEILQWLQAGRGDAGDEATMRGGMRATGRVRPAGPSPFATLGVDPEFEGVEFPVATGSVRDGTVVLELGGVPLIVKSLRGRGWVTLVTFSPERKPFVSWKHRDYLWARLARVPPAWFSQDQQQVFGGWSADGVFGAMIDSRQVRKLPVSWLLVLLVVYLVVIGPFDRVILKRLGRQMLTWVTFPFYVIFFSVLIYYIGYRLRAGETEWNELHVVDLLGSEEASAWRGRTFASIYSPVNARYRLGGSQEHATLRGEFLGLWSGGQEGSRAEVLQRDKGFEAEVAVPVWTSQLFVSDWAESRELPFRAAVVPQGPSLQFSLENRLDRPLKEVRLVYRGRVHEIGEVPAGGTVATALDETRAGQLSDWVARSGGMFQQAVQQRQHAFGDNQGRWLELSSTNVMAATFLAQLTPGQQQRSYLYPAGLELSSLVERGEALVFAWDPGQAPSATPLNRFKTVRSAKNTMYRLALPVGRAATP